MTTFDMYVWIERKLAANFNIDAPHLSYSLLDVIYTPRSKNPTTDQTGFQFVDRHSDL
jgi:hypothetical protein